MKKILSKFFYIFSISLLLSNYAYAGNMKGWSNLMISFIDQPLISTLSSMYRTQGMVLLDIGDNYASYSFAASQLTEEQKSNISTVENSKNFVLRFETCKPNSNLIEKINFVQVKRSFEEVDEFNDNFFELIEFAEEKNFIKKNFGKSTMTDNQVFLLWALQDSQDNDTFIEIQINKEIHHLVWQMTKNCT